MKRLSGAVAVLIALFAVGVGTAGRHRQSTVPTLAASSGPVSLLGSPTRPIFVLTGRRLRVPSWNPAGPPGRRRLCRLQIHGSAGHDYGDNFYVTVFASRHGRRLYGAGRYHPRSNELDCIGLVVLSKSPRRVSFTFGTAYNEFTYPLLAAGRLVRVTLGGDVWTMIVRYAPA
jgi:hypothetical protein